MRRWIGAAMLALLVMPVRVGAAPADVVISQVYGGGGNAGAPFTHDYIEVFNRGTASADVDGWSVQYASAASGTWRATPLAGEIPPGGSLLVQEASGGSSGSAPPEPDLVGTIAMAAASGKVALASVAEPLACGASCLGDPAVVDLVGYGTASEFEGSGPAAAGSNALAVVRLPCTDTDDNAADFTAEAPAPRSSADAPTPCAPPVPDDPCAGDPPPALTVALEPGTLWPPNHRMVAIERSVATDNDATVHLAGVHSSEPDSVDPVDPPGDVQVDGDALFLRAQRLGPGGGRTYTVTYEATDACGNVTRALAQVRVPHDRRG